MVSYKTWTVLGTVDFSHSKFIFQYFEQDIKVFSSPMNTSAFSRLKRLSLVTEKLLHWLPSQGAFPPYLSTKYINDKSTYPNSF